MNKTKTTSTPEATPETEGVEVHAPEAHHMGAAVEIPNPISIELMEAKDLEGKTVEEIAGLHAMLMGIRSTLDAKIAMVAAVWEHARAMAEIAADFAKLPAHKQKAMAQHLGGSHIVKDEPDVKPAESEIKAG